jgi:transposase
MKIYQLPPNHKEYQKSNGLKYIYFSYPYWNKEKNYSSHHRLYIGHIGLDGAFVPNLYYLSRLSKGLVEKPTSYPTEKERQEEILSYSNSQEENKNSFQDELIEKNNVELYYGSVYLLEKIGFITGIEEDLAKCFPDNYKQILSLVYYLILEPHSTFYRFNRWARNHKHPFGNLMTSQRISDLVIDGISERQKYEFYKLQVSRRLEHEYLAIKTTSVSSFSSLIRSIKYGRIKDKKKLLQGNIALLVGLQTRLPVYYKILPGNIEDATQFEKLIDDAKFFNLKNVKYVLDRSFYSAKNINKLYQNNDKFIISSKRNIKIFQNFVEEAKEILPNEKLNLDYYIHNLDIFCKTYNLEWTYIYKTKFNKIINEQNFEMKVHVYYNQRCGQAERRDFLKDIYNINEMIKNKEKLTPQYQCLFKKYFTGNKEKTDTVKINREVVAAKSLDFGYFILLTNEDYSPEEILTIYRKKEAFEKYFDNYNDLIEIKRAEAHSDHILSNKIFLIFISIIYFSYIDNKMNEFSIYKNKTIDEVFDDLDTIKICSENLNKSIVTQITEKQRILYEKFGVTPPS